MVVDTLDCWDEIGVEGKRRRKEDEEEEEEEEREEKGERLRRRRGGYGSFGESLLSKVLFESIFAVMRFY